MVTVYELLGQLRSTALDERDKGDKFERLVKTFLLNDPEWSARFSNVWLWSEWPGRNGRPDTGVDLVAQIRDEDTLAAIQCKFYAPGATVSKGDIDSFLSASGGKEFSRRYIFDTAKSWSPNAVDTLANQAVPVQRVDIAALEESEFDWSQYSWTTPEVLISRGKKALRPHQQAALNNVFDGFRTGDRGKLIMACGTGKTYTSLKIAEELVGAGGSVLFLVPSIQLLSQSLREWMANTEVEIRPFAVCSDVRVGRKVIQDDAADISTIDLTEPATTDAATLVARMSVGRHAKDRMTVVFSTYQSIDVIAQAQQQGLADFDLIICDEAHRTTGVTLAGATDESPFVRVHDNTYLQAKKRLYMTATPRVFGEDVRRKASDAEAILADMNDEALYGPEFHRLGFGDAVEADLLTDYKVLVLAVDENYVAENFQNAMTTAGEIALPDAAKLLGCWNGLAKHYGSADAESEATRLKPMKTAVAFAKDIRASKAASGSFPVLVDRALQEEGEHAPKNQLRVEAAHVDGTMGIHERNTHLAWLKEQTPEDVCRILTNARCLSEGVDVPALDAVMFLTPRGSQVDVVQSVGRVMRKAPGKELGYIILPIVVPSGVAPEEALKDNDRYKVVWQVLQALRSHDDRFHAMVNQIELNKVKGSSRGTGPAIDISPVPGEETEKPVRQGDGTEQGVLDFGFDGFRDAMYARIVKKVGERRYWESWAKDVSDIAQAHITRIRALLADPESTQAKEFQVFLDGLRGNLNENITADEAVEMLAQHLVTRPIFEALFSGYQFAANNPVAQTMELMLASLDEHNLDSENQTLAGFYASVRRRVQGVDNAEGKQRILIELYDKFFATAFRKTVDKLGIVYTPVEIVDFILRSVDDVLQAEFGQSLTDAGVHILDGFTGTGTFMVRLLQSGLIKPHDLARKYAAELHANEMLLLAYYIAAVNIETTYADLTGQSDAFPGLILTDTFQSYEEGDRQDLAIFPENNSRIVRQRELPITVVLGNPPYSVGQDSANDDNQNTSYPTIDDAIRRDYSADRGRGGNNSLYDSYIRAIKWATLRIADRGVIAYVTNGGFLDSNVGGEMRQSLADEFSDIYVFNLRGNGRIAGEEGRKEGRPVFEFGGWRPDGTEIKSTKGGSRATIAIVMFIKNPSKSGPAQVHYTQVDDYLTAGQKIRAVQEGESFSSLNLREITPNADGDWLSQRTDDFKTFLPIGAKHGEDLAGPTIFDVYGRGLETGRDAWVYQSSESRLRENVQRTIAAFNAQVSDFAEHLKAHPGTKPKDLVKDFIDLDATRISWTLSLKNRLAARKPLAYDADHVVTATYRPFFKQHAYFDHGLNHIRGQVPRMFPGAVPNVGFYYVGAGSAVPFSALMLQDIPDLHVTGAGSGGQFFPRWRYESVESEEGTLDFATADDEQVVDGFRRVDNITDAALALFQEAYPAEQVTKDDVFHYVYGLMHSPDYRSAYAADLKRTLPRIPFVRDFRAFVSAGSQLMDLHLGYETADPYPLTGLDASPPTGADPFDYYAVDKKMRFGKATADRRADGAKEDRRTLHFNERITLSGIPAAAHRYMLGSRSAIEWIIDRYYVRVDKASLIVNDPNDWSREVGNPRYILDMLARVVAVSVETTKIVDGLPPLEVAAD
jgi:predicted helicase